mgnify:CR=1 FL=1
MNGVPNRPMNGSLTGPMPGEGLEPLQRGAYMKSCEPLQNTSGFKANNQLIHQPNN